MLSIIHPGAITNDTAVLFLVGGPQYRVGSHRQFVQLSRFLAKAGISSMRFDYCGMGDSYGDKRSFDDSTEDITTALDTLLTCEPHIKKVYLWGLCDAASMALIYGWQDSRIKGLILLNPWLENEAAKANVMLTDYYVKRFFSRNFWQKLLLGKVNVAKSLNEVHDFSKARSHDSEQANSGLTEGYQKLMLTGLKKFNGPITMMLSGNDLTAQIFEQQIGQSSRWKKWMTRKIQVHKLPDADHTFSRQLWKNEVEQLTLTALNIKR